ncbi:MAG TPA: histidine kinase [Saprospiraceae bacterium]|nr:histidine kinase [Saprospiraceae bacterium]HPN70210.1 histidine kinase [Saprospiraceae bacterium]
MKARFWIYFFVLYAHCVFGQMPVWKSIDTEITKNFSAFEIDSLGFLWALADDGLYKYDGYQLSLVLPSAEPEISFSAIDQSAKNEIIIGTSNGSLIFFNPYNGKYESKQWIKEEITFIDCPYPDSRCLVVSYGNGCRVLKGNFDQWTSADSLLISDEVYSGAFIQNELWLATDQGIQQFTFLKNGLQTQVLDESSGLADIITTNIEVNGQNLWISNFDSGVEEVSKNRTLKFFSLPNSAKIHQIKYWKNKLFVATEEGLLTLENDQWSKIYPEVGNEKVQAFEIDQKSNLWLIGKNGKLFGASLLFEKMETQFSQIQALHRFNNQLYVGTKDGLYRREGTLWQKILATNITAIQSIHDDLLWVGTYTEGFLILNTAEKVVHQAKSWFGFENQSVFSLFVEPDKTLISSLSGLSVFNYFKKSNGELLVESAAKLPGLTDENYIYQTVKHQDTYYFATDKKGLRIVSNGQMKTVDTLQNGEKIGSVYSMEIDKKGQLWFATSRGTLAHLLSGKAIKREGIKNGGDYYSSIVGVEGGDLLMIRSNSIDRLNTSTNALQYFNEEINLKSEIPFLNTYTKEGSKVTFVHDNQLLTFKSAENQKYHPNILIDGVEVNLTKAAGRTRFNQDENNILFHFTASWLLDVDKISYAYQLVGLDQQWRKTGDRSVSYPRLRPGTYTFKVRASANGEFTGAEPTATFVFVIERYFYRSIWFYTILFCLAISLIFLYWNNRKKSQFQKSEIDRKHVESQLENLKSQLNPHFLFNSFNTLVGLIEEDNKDRSLSFVENLTDFYRLVLEHGKSKLVNFDDELKLVQLYINLLNERFEDSIVLVVKDTCSDCKIPPLVLQILAENAVKHNEFNGQNILTIEIYRSGNWICVSNNRRPKQYPVASSKSGLENIMQRYRLISNQEIVIEAMELEFIVKLPIIYKESEH